MSVGIICEYNPFHNGHLYHLNKVKEMFPNETIILVMSGNFVQRGNISIINKWDKTTIALHFGIDIVIELPFLFATQSADVFAKGAIAILKELKVDTLVFGSESNDIELLKELANIQINNKKYNQLVKQNLDSGHNYPTAMNMALKHLSQKEIIYPNDLLGLSYIKEIIKQNANITPITIKRTNDFHEEQLLNKITSATSIRKALKNQINIKDYVPAKTYEYLNHYQDNNNYFNYLKYKIISENTKLAKYQTVDEGIENRILKYIHECDNIDQLIDKIKTKRYTYNKISRMFTHILCGLTKDDAKDQALKYIRLLGFSKKGQQHLNKIKRQLNVTLITKQKQQFNNLLALDNRCDQIYNLITEQDNKNDSIIIV